MARTYTFLAEKARDNYNAINEELNPRLWSGKQMKPEVRDAILDLSEKFRKELGLTKEEVDTIKIVGGNASFQWSPESDADITIELDPQSGMTRKRFKALSKLTSVLNFELMPKINGIPTNFFLALRGLNAPIRDQSVFDVANDQWVHKPSTKEQVDGPVVLQKAQEFLEQIKTACESDDFECHKNLLSKIKAYRARGLKSGGELSFANAVYRHLSRSGEIERLKEHVNQLKKLMFQINTNGEIPSGEVNTTVSVSESILSFAQLTQMPQELPTNPQLWSDCYRASCSYYDGAPDEVQLAEALNHYCASGGRWHLSRRDPSFVTVDVEAVHYHLLENANTAQRLAQNLTSNALIHLAESSPSRTSQRVLRQVSHRGDKKSVGVVTTKRFTTEVVQPRGLRPGDNWYSTLREQLLHDRNNLLTYMERVFRLEDVLAVL